MCLIEVKNTFLKFDVRNWGTIIMDNMTIKWLTNHIKWKYNNLYNSHVLQNLHNHDNWLPWHKSYFLWGTSELFFFFKKKGYEFQDKLKRSRGGERRRGVCWAQTTKIIGRRRRRRRRKGDQDWVSGKNTMTKNKKKKEKEKKRKRVIPRTKKKRNYMLGQV